MSTDSPTTDSMDRAVKLSCRNLWKVYGGQAEQLGRDRTLFAGERAAVCDRLRQSGQLPAVIDANFEVLTGEIFVIMGPVGLRQINPGALPLAPDRAPLPDRFCSTVKTCSPPDRNA